MQVSTILREFMATVLGFQQIYNIRLVKLYTVLQADVLLCARTFSSIIFIFTARRLA